MRDFLVYLAGPISGLTYTEGQDWRDYVSQNLPQEIRGISPLRGKAQRLARTGVITASYEDNPLTSAKGLTTRDKLDCTRADMVFMNLLGAKKISVGTMIEVGWANQAGIPILLIMEKDKSNPHDHPMVRESIGWWVETVDEGLAVCEAVLMPEGEGTPREVLPPDVNLHSGICIPTPQRQLQ